MATHEELPEALARLKLEASIVSKRIKLAQVQAERDKIKELVQSQLQELVELKHQHALMLAGYRLKLAREDLRQNSARYELEIELPAKLQAKTIVQSSKTKSDSDRIRLDAELFALERVARARVDSQLALNKAHVQGLISIAEAWKSYLRAKVIDQLSKQLLDRLASAFQVDSQFRIRLNRPLKLILISNDKPPSRPKQKSLPEKSATPETAVVFERNVDPPMTRDAVLTGH